MSDALKDRLNAVLPRITSPEFLSGSGLGNEIAFYIFDYPAEEELRVREHVSFLVDQAPRKRPGLRVNHVNLFDVVIDHLKSRNLLDRAIKKQQLEGDDSLLKSLKTVLDAEKIAPVFVEAARPKDHDLVLVSGVGSVWPVLRTHTLLNNLHAPMGTTPLVIFYPGKYDGLSLRLFNKVESKNYYRAFKLVP
jgi:hypothetical protein